MTTIQKNSLSLREITPRNARSKRALEKREPQLVENPKIALFLRGSTCSQIVQLVMADLFSLKRPLAVRFSKKNDIRPFEDISSLEFFSEKNDTSLTLFGHHSKKRPHGLTFMRFYDSRILDMLELYVDPDTYRSMNQFKNTKCAVGLKPMLAFSGTLFDSPIANAYTGAKNIFIDFFRGRETGTVDVEGLQYLIQFACQEEEDGQAPPKIHMRVYKIHSKRSGQKLPRVEVEEMGPRLDFRVGRWRDADEALRKEAYKKPQQAKAKIKKNVETDLMGDKMGRIHLGRQNFDQLQTRKMKGLKRKLNAADDMELMSASDDDDIEELDAKKFRRAESI